MKNTKSIQKDITLGYGFSILESIVCELDDALSFMSTFETNEKDELQRIERKYVALADAEKLFSLAQSQLREIYHNGDDPDDSFRVCSQCDDIMVQGFCIEGGLKYYCTEKCLHENISKEDYIEMYDDEGDTYWTQWV